MKHSLAHVLFLFFVFTFFKGAISYNSDEREDIDKLENRMDDVEEKLDVLTNEVDKLLSESYEEIEEKSRQRLGVTILEVRRQRVGETIKLTVEYDAGDKTVEAKWSSDTDTAIDITTLELGNGVYLTGAVFSVHEENVTTSDDVYSDDFTTYGGIGKVWLDLVVADSGQSLGLDLEVYGEDAVETEIPTPILDIQPDGDFVYEEGEAFSYKITTASGSVGEDYSDRGYSVQAMFLYPSTGKVNIVDHAPLIIDQDERKKFLKYQEVTATISGTQDGVSGIMKFTTMRRFENTHYNEIVNNVRRSSKEIILRPSTQAGPLPDGYLGFMDAPLENPLIDDVNQVYCSPDQPSCTISCSAAGENIRDVTITMLKADGTTVDIGATSEITDYITQYSRGKKVEFTVDSTAGTTGNKIRCKVENDEGKSISTEADVVVTLPAEIIKEDSGIVMINDSVGPDFQEFEVSCTVRGYPRPNVTFYIDTSATYVNNGYYLEFRSDRLSDNMTDHGNLTYTMNRIATLPIDDIHKPWFYLNAVCRAQQDFPYYSFERYSMSYDGDYI